MKHSRFSPADPPNSAAAKASKDIVVFILVSDSKCSECGDELGKGRWMRMEDGKSLCLACADLDHLVFLPSGDTALTRRASKHSGLRAVVVRFSRARNRHERQGILVEEPALMRAEQECLADAPARERARERGAERREALDERYVAEFTTRLGTIWPGCPEAERRTIAEHACLRHSGRVGRSQSAKELDPRALELALRAHVRHVHTPYDALLAAGRDRGDARDRVAAKVDDVVRGWRGT